MSSKITFTYSHTITYSHKKLVNFNIRGMPIYEEVIQTYTIYACSKDELKNVSSSMRVISRVATSIYITGILSRSCGWR